MGKHKIFRKYKSFWSNLMLNSTPMRPIKENVVENQNDFTLITRKKRELVSV